MTNFKDKTWLERYQEMGDIAESAFDSFCVLNGIKSANFGFNRPDFQKFGFLPSMIKCMPDRIIEKGDHHFLVEVKGCGNDGILKIKQDNLAALHRWSSILPVQFAFYNSAEKSLAFPFNLVDIERIARNCETDTYGDNHKLYYLMPAELFDGWVTVGSKKSIRQLYASHGVAR